MDPVQTLHEFILNLLQDEQARSLFAADPTGALQSAGLSGITATDVHESLPLVMDYAPTHVVDFFERSTGSTADQIVVGSALGESALGSGPQGAIDQLQQITERFSFGASGHAPTSALDGVLKSITDFTADGDVAPSLDTTVGQVAGSGLGQFGGVVGSTHLGGLDGVSHLDNTDDLVKTATGVTGVTGQLHTGTAPIGIDNTVGSVSHNPDSVLNTVHGDQALQHAGLADHAVQDLNIGSDLHGTGIGDANLGGIHAGEALGHNDITHHAGF
jgi:hypothetical protein